jgi:hypothetical protein
MLKNNPTAQWLPEVTTTHQDHVIAHVVGATVLGYFVHDEAAHLLLDMGFIWSVYLDGQMVLLPESVALGELEAGPELRAQLKKEIEILQRDGREAEALRLITASPVECLLTEVEFFAKEDRRRLILVGEVASLLVESSLTSAEITIGAA